jgi:Zn-dependent M28 family amino/carboxypeptidase
MTPREGARIVSGKRIARMTFWIGLVAAVAGFLGYMLWMPGKSYSGALRPLSPEQAALGDNLRRHVTAVASREHHALERVNLEAAARYIENALAGFGYRVATQPFEVATGPVRNIEVEIAGAARAREIIVVGAHYDSIIGAPGANDNGSGVAAVLELARLLKGAAPARTLRLVFFVNEEPPFFRSDDMGSRRYAARAKERQEKIVGMFSIETIGYYSDRRRSQRYPFPLGFFYPDTGNFLAFVSNPGSRRLLHEALAAFRRHAAFPSEGAAAPAALTGVDWSDQWSFWEEGYPALMVTDTAPFRYPHYHTREDTPDKVDYERLARVTDGLARMLRELAGDTSYTAKDAKDAKEEQEMDKES